jgi:hypothetical protein
MDPITESERAVAVQSGLRVYHIAELEGIGAAHVGESPHRPPSSSDLATFCYTSGKLLKLFIVFLLLTFANTTASSDIATFCYTSAKMLLLLQCYCD